jgi:hypothetical protein
MIDQRIAAIHARDIFTENQRDVLVTTVNDARDDLKQQVTKAVDDIRARFETLERRVHAPGVLPPVKAWRQGMVVYEGELASFVGELYQAKFDTGLQPGDPDAWTCVARAGKDAAQVTPKGSWSASINYDMLSLVTYQDGAYLATRSDPGEPGGAKGGWQMIAGKGSKGDPGPRGPRGNRGDRGAAETPVTIREWSIDIKGYRASPILSNGEVGAILDLRPFFERFGCETGIA